jgi:hypothetical protein
MRKIVDVVARVWDHLDPKVRTPFLAALGATVVQFISTGSFDAGEVATTGTAVLTAVVGYWVPNLASYLRAEGTDEPVGDVAGL